MFYQIGNKNLNKKKKLAVDIKSKTKKMKIKKIHKRQLDATETTLEHIK